jgi:hypothetical protein
MSIIGVLAIAFGIGWTIISWARAGSRDKVLELRQLTEGPCLVGLAVVAGGAVLIACG